MRFFRSRWWRWGLRPVAWLVGLFALAVVGLQVLCHSLDAPWLKRRVLAFVRASAGIDVEYRTARVDLLSGAHVEGLVVRSPEEVRPVAPELVRVDRVDVGWSAASLLSRRGPVVERLRASNVLLTAVVDEHGRTSFDALSSPGSTTASTSKTPLSGQAAKLLRTAPPLGQLDVDSVTVALARTEGGKVSERSELRGLAVTLVASPAAPAVGGWRMDAHLGSAPRPLDLELTRSQAGREADRARAALWIAVGGSSSEVAVALDLRMKDQTFAAGFSADHWLHADANLRFDPGAGRTSVKLDHVEAGDGAATATATLDVPDTGDPVVVHARGDIDLARLLRWLPAGVVPLTAERAHARWQVDSLIAGRLPSLSTGGSLLVEAELANVAGDGPAGPFEIGRVALSLHAQPTTEGGISGHASVKLAGVGASSDGDRIAVDDAALDLDGERRGDDGYSARLGVTFARATVAGARPVSARDGRVELRVGELRPDFDAPLSTRGEVGLSVELGSLDAALGGARGTVDGVRLRVHTVLAGRAPYGVELDAQSSRLRVVGRDGRLVVNAPARIEAKARGLQPDLDRPAASRGSVKAHVDLGAVQAWLYGTKDKDALDFGLQASAPSLAVIRPFLGADFRERAPWDRMAVTVRSNGQVAALGGRAPTLRQTTVLHVERPAYGSMAARSLSATVHSQGTALRHQADVDVLIPGLTIDGGAPSDDHVTLSAAVDRERPSLDFKLATEGRAATNVSGSVSFDPLRRAVVFETDGHLAGLAPLAPFAARVHGLDAFDLSKLDVRLSSRGAVLGVVEGVAHDGTVELSPSPTRTAAVEGTADLQVAHFHWVRGDSAITAPSVAWHGDMRAAGERRTLVSRIELGTVHLDLGSRDVDLNGVKEDGTVSVTGDLIDPDIELTQRLSIGAVEQDLVPEYPVGDLTFALSSERSSEGVIHLSHVDVSNRLGGTALTLSGTLDLGEGRRTLSVTSSLTQDLARLSTIPERFKGSGKLAVQANVTSPDLALYTVRASVKGHGVSVTLPRAGLELVNANGEVPVTVSLDVGEKGVALVRTEKPSPYSMLRFADQHPLLAHGGFLSITSLKTPFVSIAPLAGNLEIEQNVISLRQFEMGVRGGTITGQCGLDWNGLKSTLELHVRASGVQSSHGEPFDGNISVIVSAADRTIEGRAEVLRIGERHLLDLLDLQDPLHVDPAMNRIRSALAFGYPDTMRLVFDHGFASAHLELGGLARLISISDLRGIPMGPIIDRVIAKMRHESTTKEAP